MNVATRQFGRAVRLPGSPAFRHIVGSGLSKSAVSRRFKALTQAHFNDWIHRSDLSEHAHHCDPDRPTASGRSPIDDRSRRHWTFWGKSTLWASLRGPQRTPLPCRPCLDNLIERGLDPEGLLPLHRGRCQSAVITKASRRTFGVRHPHSALPDPASALQHPHPTGSTRTHSRSCATCSEFRHGNWMTPTTAERLMRNHGADRLEMEAGRMCRNRILEGIDEILTVVRLGLPNNKNCDCSNGQLPYIIESMNSVIRRVCRNVKRWRDAKMALREDSPPGCSRASRKAFAASKHTLMTACCVAILKQAAHRSPLKKPNLTS